MTTDQRLGKVEGELSSVRVILEGKPIRDIAGNLIGTEGGLVQQMERNAEALHIIDRKIDGLLPRRWTRNQVIALSSVVVVFVVGAVPIVRAF